MAMEIIIGVGSGKLALKWANWVREEILKLDRKTKVDLKAVALPGRLAAAASSGQVKEEDALAVRIRKELLSGRINAVIQSAERLPFSMSGGVRMAAVLRRRDVRNAFLSLDCSDIAELPRRGKVGTCGSLRKAQILRIRADLGVVDLQGDFSLFLSQLKSGRLNALVLPAADVEMLGWDKWVKGYLPSKVSLPSPGQGAVVLEVREDDDETAEFLAPLDDGDTRLSLVAEHEFLRALGGAPGMPIGAWARIEGPNLFLDAVVLSPDGRMAVRQNIVGLPDDAPQLGHMLGQRMLGIGASEIISLITSRMKQPAPAGRPAPKPAEKRPARSGRLISVDKEITDLFLSNLMGEKDSLEFRELKSSGIDPLILRKVESFVDSILEAERERRRSVSELNYDHPEVKPLLEKLDELLKETFRLSREQVAAMVKDDIEFGINLRVNLSEMLPELMFRNRSSISRGEALSVLKRLGLGRPYISSFESYFSSNDKIDKERMGAFLRETEERALKDDPIGLMLGLISSVMGFLGYGELKEDSEVDIGVVEKILGAKGLREFERVMKVEKVLGRRKITFNKLGEILEVTEFSDFLR